MFVRESFFFPSQRRIVSVSVIVRKRVSKLLVNFIHKHITGSFVKITKRREEDSRVNHGSNVDLLEPSFS